MFWGVTFEAGRRYTQTPTEPFHVSMAALEPRDSLPRNALVSLMLEHKGKEFLLCNLDYSNLLQIHLDLNFAQGEEIIFFVNGEGPIHLSGYVNGIKRANVGMQNWNVDFIQDFPAVAGPSGQTKNEPQANIDDVDSDEDENEDVHTGVLLEDIDDEDNDDQQDKDFKPEKETSYSRRMRSQRQKFDPEYSALDDDALEAIEPDEDEDEDSYEDEEDEEDDSSDNEDEDSSSEQDEDDREKVEILQERYFQTDEDEELSEQENAKSSTAGSNKKKRKKNAMASSSVKKSKTNIESTTPNRSSTMAPFVLKEELSSDSDDNDVLESSIGRTPMPVKKMRNGLMSSNASPNFKPCIKSEDAKLEWKFGSKLPGGIEIQDVRIGKGPVAKEGKLAHVFYTGKLNNNKEFDAIRPGKNPPLSFRVGRGEVIAGWDKGIIGMRVGGKRLLKVPPELGYGMKNVGPIPSNSTLFFTLELSAVS